MTAKASSSLTDRLRDLIDLIDKLRDVGVNDVIKLPRIAVVGSQSAGKSSVLDSIVGLDILPKGDGVVTRCPLELRLHRLPAGSDEWPYAIIKRESGSEEERIDELNDVQEAIVRMTDKMAGTNHGIVEEAIVLSIFTHDCPDLTLVDLPGITRVPLKGSDQAQNIEALTKNMVLKYINNDRVIILAVVPGNQDATTTDALQLARQVDPEMKRTIGVITKVDIMDKGTDAKELLLGNVVDLTLGFVAVKNRSKEQVVNGKSVRDALVEEDLFFKDHPVYSQIKPSLLGTKSLVVKLCEEYRLHAKALLPKLKAEIATKRDATAGELVSLGDELPSDDSLIRDIALDVTQQYLEQLEAIFDGKDLVDLSETSSMESRTPELFNRARFRTICRQALSVLNVDLLMKNINSESIQQVLDMLDGEGLRGFLDPRIFKVIVKPLLKNIQAPANTCLADTSYLLESLCTVSADSAGVTRFPDFRECLVNIAHETVHQARKATEQVIAQYCTATTEYIYESSDHVSRIFDVSVDSDEVQLQDELLREISEYVKQYLTVVVQEAKNVIPRTLGCFMVDAFLKKVKTNVYRVSMRPDLRSLFEETEDARVHREHLKARKIALDKADALLRKYFSA